MPVEMTVARVKFELEKEEERERESEDIFRWKNIIVLAVE